MKKQIAVVVFACLCFSIVNAKNLPKIKETKFDDKRYVQNVIKSYGLAKDTSVPNSPRYDKAERYVNGDDFVEIAERKHNVGEVIVTTKYVGMCINGVYASRTWSELEFPNSTTLVTAVYEDSKELSSNEVDGLYYYGSDIDEFYFFESVEFRTLVRTTLKSKYPERLREKDAEMSNVFYQFFLKKKSDEVTVKRMIKNLQAITEKYQD